MKYKILRCTIGDLKIAAKRGIWREYPAIDPRRCVCPVCKENGAEKKPIADITQFGFSWDSCTTIFKCECGQQFYADYLIWHDLGSATPLTLTGG